MLNMIYLTILFLPSLFKLSGELHCSNELWKSVLCGESISKTVCSGLICRLCDEAFGREYKLLCGVESFKFVYVRPSALEMWYRFEASIKTKISFTLH